MKIKSLFNITNGTENKNIFSSYSFEEINSCFYSSTWGHLSYSQKLELLQELENRFSNEQGRPSKHVTSVPMLGNTLGEWDKQNNTITINEFLMNDGVLTTDPLTEGNFRPDAGLLVYETVAHEGYHAYQDYAIENPDEHISKTQFEEWKLNSFSVNNNKNYVNPKDNYLEYRIQPLERDASKYGYLKAEEAAKDIEKKYGNQFECSVYRNSCKINSYENVLREAQRENPYVLENMKNRMETNKEQWIKESRGESHVDASLKNDYIENAPEDFSELNRDNVSIYRNPYVNDTGYSEHINVRSLSNTSKVEIPSLHERYIEESSNIYNALSNGEISEDEYFKSIYDLQDELHYYPQYDHERMDIACKEEALQGFTPLELETIKTDNPQVYENLCKNIACKNGYISFENEEEPQLISTDYINDSKEEVLQGGENDLQNGDFENVPSNFESRDEQEDMSKLNEMNELNGVQETDENENMNTLFESDKNVSEKTYENEDMKDLAERDRNTFKSNEKRESLADLLDEKGMPDYGEDTEADIADERLGKYRTSDLGYGFNAISDTLSNDKEETQTY